MIIKFASSTKGFYSYAVHGNAIPSDAVEITTEQHYLLLDGQSLGKLIVADDAGYPILIDPPAPTQEQLSALYASEIQSTLDTYARSWGYDSVVSAASYSASTITKFKNEAMALITWRDAVWQWAEQYEADILSNTVPMPTSKEEFILSMPASPARPV